MSNDISPNGLPFSVWWSSYLLQASGLQDSGSQDIEAVTTSGTLCQLDNPIKTLSVSGGVAVAEVVENGISIVFNCQREGQKGLVDIRGDLLEPGKVGLQGKSVLRTALVVTLAGVLALLLIGGLRRVRKFLYITLAVIILLLILILLLRGTFKMTPTPSIQAWVYPGPPSCSAMTELADGRTIDTIKAQYYALSDTGVLKLITDATCNGYSAANAALVKAHSKHQFVTISGSIAGIVALSKSQALTITCTSLLVAFLTSTGFTGVEWDIEGFSDWAPAQYIAYKAVMASMGQALHAHGFQLMIDGPAIINPTYQGYYPNFRYEDFQSLPIDKIVSMCYDFQSDNGNGTPVASLSDLTGCCQWMKARISDPSRVVIGVNSYGYHGATSAYTSTADTYQQSTKYPGFSTARRDASSGEMLWSNEDKSYSYSDTTTLNLKVQTVLNAGYSQISIWHLGGGNAWLSQSAQPTPVSPDSALTAFHAAYPGFDAWYAENFDAQGNYLG